MNGYDEEIFELAQTLMDDAADHGEDIDYEDALWLARRRLARKR